MQSTHKTSHIGHVFLLKLSVGAAEAMMHIQLIFILDLEFTQHKIIHLNVNNLFHLSQLSCNHHLHLIPKHAQYNFKRKVTCKIKNKINSGCL